MRVQIMTKCFHYLANNRGNVQCEILLLYEDIVNEIENAYFSYTMKVNVPYRMDFPTSLTQ